MLFFIKIFFLENLQAVLSLFLGFQAIFLKSGERKSKNLAYAKNGTTNAEMNIHYTIDCIIMIVIGTVYRLL